MTVATTYDERIALIKQIADRRKKMEKIKLGSKKARKVMLEARKNRKDPLDYLNVKEGENPNHWTDGSKYAKEYYGETLFETTRYDNEWD
jgi:hypothetical protein